VTRTTRYRRSNSNSVSKAYERLATELTRVRFIGRLATYRYYNMDQVVGQALASFNRIVEEPPVMEDYGTSRACRTG